MPELSAGIILHRRRGAVREILLIHPGGPFWRNKDEGAWMIPKGRVEAGETEVAAALREFVEELGTRPQGTPKPLCRIRQSGGKWVQAFALEGDIDADHIVSNMFEVEWPPRSGHIQSFPEVDRAAWFAIDDAKRMILKSQRPIVSALENQD